MANTRVIIAYEVVRALLAILLALIFLVATIYFIKAIDAIGDDVEEARETHWGHEVEEAPFIFRPRVKHPDEEEEEEETTGNNKEGTEEEGDDIVTVYRRPSSHRGRLITGHHHFTVTKSQHKQHHIISLIIWVVLTLFCAILSLAGILGVFCENSCLVMFSACMILVHAIFSHILPWFKIQLPEMTSNWFLLVLEVPAIMLAVAYVGLHRAKQKAAIRRMKQRRILY